MASVLERVPVEEIRERAATIDLKDVLLRLAAAPFMAVGFLGAFLFATATWCCGAVLVGWNRGRQATDAADAERAAERADKLRVAEQEARAAIEQANAHYERILAERKAAEFLASRPTKGG